MNSEQLETRLKEFMGFAKHVILTILAIEWPQSVKRNFVAGGRDVDPWPPRKRISKKQRGRNILVISGALKNYSATADEPASRVTLVADPRARAYSQIQNEGGIIHVPSRAKKFRNVKTASGKVRTVFASNKHKKTFEKQTKAHDITIPKREHTNIPQGDVPGILDKIKSTLNT